MVLGGTWSVEGATLRVVLNGKWWDLVMVSMELSHAYWKRKINGDTNRLTNKLTNQQGKYSAICLFEGWKIEGRVQRFAI